MSNNERIALARWRIAELEAQLAAHARAGCPAAAEEHRSAEAPPHKDGRIAVTEIEAVIGALEATLEDGEIDFDDVDSPEAARRAAIDVLDQVRLGLQMGPRRERDPLAAAAAEADKIREELGIAELERAMPNARKECPHEIVRFVVQDARPICSECEIEMVEKSDRSFEPKAGPNACVACGKPANYKLFISPGHFETVCEGSRACEDRLRAAPTPSETHTCQFGALAFDAHCAACVAERPRRAADSSGEADVADASFCDGYWAGYEDGGDLDNSSDVEGALAAWKSTPPKGGAT